MTEFIVVLSFLSLERIGIVVFGTTWHSLKQLFYQGNNHNKTTASQARRTTTQQMVGNSILSFLSEEIRRKGGNAYGIPPC